MRWSERATGPAARSTHDTSLLLARRNLFRDRTRFLISVAGVAASVGLMLLLSGYRAGVYRQASALAVERDRTVSAERDGETSFFCSRGCREEFLGGLPPPGAGPGAAISG